MLLRLLLLVYVYWTIMLSFLFDAVFCNHLITSVISVIEIISKHIVTQNLFVIVVEDLQPAQTDTH